MDQSAFLSQYRPPCTSSPLQWDKRLEDESADIIKKLFPDTTEQDDDDYLGYGLQLLEIYDSDEEGEDENINWYINVFRLKLIYFKYVFHWILANNEIDM